MTSSTTQEESNVIALLVFDEIVVMERFSICDSLGLEIRHVTAGDAQSKMALVYHFVESKEGEYAANMVLDRLFEKTLERWNARGQKSQGVELDT